MIRVRPEQKNALARDFEARLNNDMVAYARKRFPDEFRHTPDNELLEQVIETRAAAKKHGITLENDVATYLDLTIMYGKHFPTADWAIETMSDIELTGSQKTKALRNELGAYYDGC